MLCCIVCRNVDIDFRGLIHLHFVFSIILLYLIQLFVPCLTYHGEYSIQITPNHLFPVLRAGEWWSMEFDVKVTLFSSQLCFFSDIIPPLLQLNQLPQIHH